MKGSKENLSAPNTVDSGKKDQSLEEQLELFAEIIIDIFLQKQTPNEKEEP